MLRVHGLDITGESGKREYGVKGKPSAVSVIFNTTAIYDGRVEANICKSYKPFKNGITRAKSQRLQRKSYT
jgi:hypothetical protein